MSGPGSLTGIRQRLSEAMRIGRSLEAELLVDQVPHRAIWRTVDRAFNSVGELPARRTMREAVLGFMHRGAVQNFVQLKHVCYGATLPLNEDGERLIDRSDLLDKLLREVDASQPERRRYRRCYQALMQSFFSLEPDADAGGLEVTEGAAVLRGWLSERLGVVARRVEGQDAPAWVLTLQDHGNLLSARPCDRYVAELQQGRTDELAGICEKLGIARDSWVWQAVILAYLAEICGRADDGFKAAIDPALDLADGATALKPAQAVSRSIAAALVKRYCRAAVHPELPRLRDAAIARIGNPWLQRSQWDAWVENEPARQMVDGWLKARLMEDFFTLLSDQGGGTDQRRLRYWLRFVPVISDMWFVLGAAARRNNTDEFVEMRQRMEGRRHDLVHSPDEHNNAFVMRIGNHFFVEFGVKGNACYHYPADRFPHNLIDGDVRVATLKRGGRPSSHSHLPAASWELEFDRKFCPLIGFVPSGAAQGVTSGRSGVPGAGVVQGEVSRSRTERLKVILQRCDDLRITVDDRRAKGGSLWIALRGDQYPVLRKQLELCGFRFSAGKQMYYLDEDR